MFRDVAPTFPCDRGFAVGSNPVIGYPLLSSLKPCLARTEVPKAASGHFPGQVRVCASVLDRQPGHGHRLPERFLVLSCHPSQEARFKLHPLVSPKR